jgi:hypothetical protein
VHFIERINPRNTFLLHFSQNLKNRSTTDPNLLERTAGTLKDVRNHISTLFGIESNFNYENCAQI